MAVWGEKEDKVGKVGKGVCGLGCMLLAGWVSNRIMGKGPMVKGERRGIMYSNLAWSLKFEGGGEPG